MMGRESISAGELGEILVLLVSMCISRDTIQFLVFLRALVRKGIVLLSAEPVVRRTFLGWSTRLSTRLEALHT